MQGNLLLVLNRQYYDTEYIVGVELIRLLYNLIKISLVNPFQFTGSVQ